MNIFDNYKHVVFKNYATFSGRATRSEYWYFILLSVIITIVLSMLDQALGTSYGDDGGLLENIYSVLIIIPAIAAAVRRIHDSDKSGWWVLLPLYNLYLVIRKGTDGPNRFGENPLGTTTAPAAETPAPAPEAPQAEPEMPTTTTEEDTTNS